MQFSVNKTCICLTSLLILMTDIGATKASEPARSVKPIRIVFHSLPFSNAELLGMASTSRILSSIEELPPVLERLYQSLAREGYPLARLDSLVLSHDEREEDIDLYISVGKAVTVMESDIVGVDDEDIHSIGQGTRLTEREVLKQAGEILNRFTDMGYPFTRITLLPNMVKENEEDISLRLNLQVDKGDFIRLRKIDFPGRRITHIRLLQLESGLRAGDMFSHSRLRRAMERLERLPYIDYISEPLFEDAGEGLINVHLPVRERRVNTILAVLSTTPGQENPTGEIKLVFGNIMGTGRRMRLEWLNLDPARRGILVSYREPWIFGYPWHCSLGMEQWTEDELSTTTRYQFEFEWDPTDRITLSGAITSENISGRNNISPGLNSQAVWFGGSLRYDRFDQDWNPSRGYRANVASASALRHWKQSGRGPSRLKRESLSASLAQSLSSDFVLFERFEVQDISGSGVVPEELIRVGGTGSVRGYAESVILARGVGCGSLELRWRPDRDSYLGFFADMGYVYREDWRIAARDRYPLSFGITTTMVTKVGRLGLDLALASGETLQNARLHMRLEGWF